MGFTSQAARKGQADLILFNTCCVRDNAEQKVFGNVGKLKQEKRKNKKLLVGVCGCMMQQEDVAGKAGGYLSLCGHNLWDAQPAWLRPCWRACSGSTGDFPRVERTLAVSDQEDLPDETPAFAVKPPLSAVNIMQGCDNFCTYCIVPYVRGRERSRSSRKRSSEGSARTGKSRLSGE